MSDQADRIVFARWLGGRIERLRREAGLGPSEFSRRVGVSRNATHRWERGYASPEAIVLPRIARTLGVSLTGLFDD